MNKKQFRVNDLVKFNYSEIGKYVDENHTDIPLRNDKVCDLLNEQQVQIKVYEKSLIRKSKKISEQQATIDQLNLAIDDLLSHTSCDEIKKENEQLKNELRKEKSLREYSDSMYGADLIVNIRFSNGEWKVDVSVIDDE